VNDGMNRKLTNITDGMSNKLLVTEQAGRPSRLRHLRQKAGEQHVKVGLQPVGLGA